MVPSPCLRQRNATHRSRSRLSLLFGLVRSLQSISLESTIIQIETDHKPLVPILGTTQQDSLPPRVLRFQLRLTRFNYSHPSDVFAHFPVLLSNWLNVWMTKMSRDSSKCSQSKLPASKERMEQFCKAQKDDPICSTVIKYAQNEWPVKHAARKYKTLRK